MGWLVAMIGLTHLAMGFAVAVWLARRLAAAPEAEPAWTLPAPQPVQAAAPPQPEPPPPAPPREADLPPAWRARLDEAGKENTFGKVMLEVLRLDVGTYREHLVQIDERLRAREVRQQRQAIDALLARLQQVNAAYLADHNQALEQLHIGRTGLGHYAALAERLETLLLQQAAQIETTCSNLSGLRGMSEITTVCVQAAQEVCRLLDLVHHLRDELLAILLAIAVEERWLESLERKLLLDPVLQIPNRVGLAAALEKWWREDPARCRLAGMAMLNLDGLGAINMEHGARVADRLLAGVAELVTNLLYGRRHAVVLARYQGPRLAILLKDIGPQQATAIVDRIRNQVAGTSFEHEGIEVRAMLTCAVTELLPHDTISSPSERLEAGLRRAVASGGNCTWIERPAQVRPAPAGTEQALMTASTR